MPEINGLGCVLPSREICNDEIIDLVQFFSRDSFSGNFPRLFRRIREMLNLAGSQNRFWRGTSESPKDMVVKAIEDALQSANSSRDNVDLILFVSVDRGFIEPANANFIADLIGISGVRAFDVVDACMGWWTGVEVALNSFNAGEAETALVVSVECPMGEDQALVPDCFCLNSEEELAWKMPAYTFGEGVTATFLSHTNKITWRSEMISDSRFAHLCTVPYRDFRRFYDSSELIGLSGPGSFTAFGREMGQKGFKNGVKVLRRLLARMGEIDYLIPHTFSEFLPRTAARTIGVEDRLYSIFPLVGNLATSAIPTALFRLVGRKEADSRSRLVGWIASAGLKYAAFEIRLG